MAANQRGGSDVGSATKMIGAMQGCGNEGDFVWMEDLGYIGARGALQIAGARLIPVPVDEQGLRVSDGVRLHRNARLVCVTPSNQYPLTVTMSLQRRLELLEWAENTGAWIIEDDYDSEFRYKSRPIAALQGLDRYGRVIYLGTFSKLLAPTLRIGYFVLPPELEIVGQRFGFLPICSCGTRSGPRIHAGRKPSDYMCACLGCRDLKEADNFASRRLDEVRLSFHIQGPHSPDVSRQVPLIDEVSQDHLL